MSDSFQFPGQPGSAGSFPSQPAPSAGFPQAGGGFPPAAGGFSAATPARGPISAPPGRAPEQAPSKGSRRSKEKKAKEPKPAKPVTRRLISRQVGIAAVFAVVASGAVWFQLSGTDGAQYVVRVSSDLAAGAPVTADSLEAVTLPAAAIEPGTFTASSKDAALDKALDALDGVVAQYPLAARSQLREASFGLQPTLGQDLAPTERLVSITASVASSVAGGLSVGDHVDIFGASDGVSTLIASNVPITAISVSEDGWDSVADAQRADPDLTPADSLPGDPVPGLYVVKVAADQVPALVNWNESATLYLTYRGVDAVDVPAPDNVLGAASSATDTGQ